MTTWILQSAWLSDISDTSVQCHMWIWASLKWFPRSCWVQDFVLSSWLAVPCLSNNECQTWHDGSLSTSEEFGWRTSSKMSKASHFLWNWMKQPVDKPKLQSCSTRSKQISAFYSWSWMWQALRWHSWPPQISIGWKIRRSFVSPHLAHTICWRWIGMPHPLRWTHFR